MTREKRLEKILIYLNDHDSATIEELCRVAQASVPTVYRDLQELSRRDLVARSVGVVRHSREGAVTTPAYRRRMDHVPEKARIARAALRLVHDDMTLFLDASTTASFLVEGLRKFRGLTVITNGLPTAMRLTRAGIPAVCVGGALTKNSLAVGGRIACDSIARFSIDLAFFSAYGITHDGKIADPSEYETALRRFVLKRARESALLCDHSKFGRSSIFHIAALRDIDYLVTDVPRTKEQAPVKKKILLP